MLLIANGACGVHRVRVLWLLYNDSVGFNARNMIFLRSTFKLLNGIRLVLHMSTPLSTTASGKEPLWDLRILGLLALRSTTSSLKILNMAKSLLTYRKFTNLSRRSRQLFLCQLRLRLEFNFIRCSTLLIIL